MCEFISWVEYDDKVLFLTDKDINALERKKWNKDKSETCGHGAIKFLYDLKDGDGEQKECTDFSTPDNFPKEIVKAIKQGKMTYGDMPRGLLNNRLFYRTEAKLKPLYDDYKAKLETLGDDYAAKLKPLDDDYAAKRKPLDDDYAAKRKPLDDKQWELFTNPKNRTKNWR